MSDDFDDLDWLNNDDSDDDSASDDLSSLDWLQDDNDDKQSDSGDSLGVTGELDWLRNDDDDDDAGNRDERLGVTGELDWLSDSDDGAGQADGERTGVTGELAWLGDNAPSEIEAELDAAEEAGLFSLPDDDSSDEEADSTPQEESSFDTSLPEVDNLFDDFSHEFADDFDDSRLFYDANPEDDAGGEDSTDSAPDLPPWMSDIQPDDLEAVSDDALEEDLPEWMQETTAQDDSASDFIAEEPDAEEVPEWMSSTGVLAGDGDDESEEAPEWMSSTGVLADDGDDESEEAPEWMSSTGVLAGDGDDESEEIPEWMSSTGVLAGDGDDESEETPAWMLNTDQLYGESSAEDDDHVPEAVPDWLAKDTSEFEHRDDDLHQPVAQDIPDADEAEEMPDWLAKDTNEFEHRDDDLHQPVAQDDPDEAEEVPAWLSEGGDVADSEADIVAEPEGTGELPPWMAETPYEDALEDSSLVEGVADGVSADWLEGAESSYESDELNTLFEGGTGELEDFDNIFGDDDFAEEDVDDLFGELVSEGDSADLDALLRDSEDDMSDSAFADLFEDAGDADDIFAGVSEASGEAGDDLFGQFEDDLSDDDIFETAGIDASELDVFDENDSGANDFDPDAFFGDLESTAEGADDNFDDLFGEPDQMTIEEDYDVFSDEQVVATEQPATGNLEDLFAEVDSTPDTVADMMNDDFGGLFGDDADAESQEMTDDDFATLFDDNPVMEDDALGDFDEIDSAEVFFSEQAQPEAEDFNFDLDSVLGDTDDPEFDLESLAEDSEEHIDWFTDEVQPQRAKASAITDDMSWLDGVDEDSIQLDMLEEDLSAEDATYGNVEDFLATLEDNSPALPKTGSLVQADVDFDTLFEEDRFEDMQVEDDDLTEREFSPDSPEWLTDAGFSVSGVSAASIVRGQQDRPIEDLPDALQALHDRASAGSAKPETPIPQDRTKILEGVANPLKPISMPEVTPSMAVPLHLTEAQMSQAALLQSITGIDTSAMDALAEDDAQPKAQAGRRFANLRIDRLLISLILLAIVVIPFVLDDVEIGDLPPPVFQLDSYGMSFYQQMENLQAGQYVLVAVEYGTTGAAELDDGTDAVLRHILTQGAIPVIVGGDPSGLLHVRHLMDNIVGIDLDDDAELEDVMATMPQLVANRDYYVGRYLIADALGVRAFSQNVDYMVSTDLQGEETGLDIESLDEFALIVLISERADDVRTWAEQVAPETVTPIMAIVSQSASPLAQPYIDSEANIGGITGLLVGYQDTHTYRTMLGAPYSGEVDDITTYLLGDDADSVDDDTDTDSDDGDTPITTTEESTPEITAEPTEDVTDEPTVEPTAIPTESPTDDDSDDDDSDDDAVTETVAPTATVLPTDTPEPTNTEIPSETPTETTVPTETPVPTNTSIPMVSVTFGVVNTDGAVNLRGDPSTNNPPVGVLQGGDRVLIIGQNEDGSWFEVLTEEDSTLGWLASFLLDLEVELVPPDQVPEGAEPTQGSPKRHIQVMQDDATEEPDSDDDDKGETRGFTQPEATPDLSDLDSLLFSEDSTFIVFDPDDNEYRDERWYSMTMGIIGAIAIIGLGTIVNLFRALMRRRRGG